MALNHTEPRCPCESGRPYRDCCAPYHQGAAAPDAETLMRSRYCAYAKGLEAYLLATWHSRTRPASLGLADAPISTRWLGLRVVRHLPTGADAAEVEFIARYREGGGSAVRLHERSRFLREDGRWYYVDGEFPQGRR